MASVGGALLRVRLIPSCFTSRCLDFGGRMAIIHFKAVDMSTFRATFNHHNIIIQKLPTNPGWWQLYIDDIPVCSPKPTAKKLMEQVEATASNIITKRAQEYNQHVDRIGVRG